MGCNVDAMQRALRLMGPVVNAVSRAVRLMGSDGGV